MIHDMEFLQSRMSKLEGSAELSQHLLQIANTKHIAQEAEKTPKKPEPQAAADVAGSPAAQVSEDTAQEEKT